MRTNGGGIQETHAIPAPPANPASPAPREEAPAFCRHCGARRQGGGRFCSECGGSLDGEAKSAISDRAATLARDLVTVLRSIARDPILGIPSAYEQLQTPARRRLAGGALAVLATLLLVLGLSFGAERISGAVTGGLFTYDFPFIQTFLALLGLPLMLTLGAYLLRRTTGKGTTGVDPDLFTAAACMLPLGLVTFLATVLGAGNAEIGLLLFLVGTILAMLMLFSGWTRVGELSPRAAAWSLPFLLLASAWACKVILMMFV